MGPPTILVSFEILIAERELTWVSNRHRKISNVSQDFETKDGLQLFDSRIVLRVHKIIDLRDNSIDTSDAVLGSELLNWIIPIESQQNSCTDAGIITIVDNPELSSRAHC